MTDWRPKGHAPVLYTSPQAVFDGQKAIRGGVPICLPWFGPHPTDPNAPAHGLARTATWEKMSEAKNNDGATVKLGLRLPGLDLRYRIHFGRELELSLRVTADAAAHQPQRVEVALHTYLAVSDAQAVTLSGLEHAPYLNSLLDDPRCDAANEPIRFTGETDRVYPNTSDDVVLHDPGLERRITVSKRGGCSTVVWNPWIAKAARLADFGDDQWQRMCCIESAAVGDDAWEIDPGESRTLSVTLRVAAE